MPFQIGDQVVHRSYGPGNIIQLDEKEMGGRSALYYVVKVGDMTIWVSAEETENNSLRPLTTRSEFESLFKILQGAGERLSEDRNERRISLNQRFKDGTSETMCRLIRDLSSYGYEKKLTDHDSTVLERARKFLLAEWMLTFSISLSDAEQQLDGYLEEGKLLAIPPEASGV